ncbi:rCG63593 [Rattus norvegicus]|uniref:RCG63593 n=1 Tax=Rattus norvegicus TaxID=10116 RepID=A6I5P8_RAT|nr:rCG63593 [Rattus norvegicus]
MEEYFGKGV